MRLISFFICFVLLFSLASCSTESLSQTEEAKETKITTDVAKTDEKTEETEEQPDTYDYPEVADKITWDDINAFPIANSSMSTDELRNLCVEFFRFSKSFAWTPSANWKYYRNAKGVLDLVEKGVVYGGLPYVGLGSGNVYRTMDYYDPETGILDIKEAGKDRFLFGNQCSLGAYWGWGRVVNSARLFWSPDCIQSNGFIPVGPYTYTNPPDRLNENHTTKQIVESNGQQVMFESYAKMQPADGLVYYTTSGHVIMCSSVPFVARNDDGTINGDESYILKIDQGQRWVNYPQSNGDARDVKSGIDTKLTFTQLFSAYYIPFTFAEFLGQDPVEDAVCNFSHTGETITFQELKGAKVTANYGISDIYLTVKDTEGKEVFRQPVRTKTATNMDMPLEEHVLDTTWKEYTNGKNKLEITVQLSNGTRPVIYEGTLTQ